MSDLHGRLLAAIGERERLAREALIIGATAEQWVDRISPKDPPDMYDRAHLARISA
jgi:hypothetical protein